MAHASGNRILQQSITTGTGTYALGTVLPGMLGFETEIGIGNTCWYCAASTDGYEIGIGTVGSGTLARTSILESSNSDAAVSWASGTRNLFVLHPVQKQVYVGTDGQLNIGGSAITLTDGVFLVADGANIVGESGATARTSLGLTIGTNVQAYNANLAAIAGLSPSANTFAVFTGASTAGLTAFTQQAAELCDDTSFGAMATTLGLGSGSTPTFAGATIPTINAASGDLSLQCGGVSGIVVDSAQTAASGYIRKGGNDTHLNLGRTSAGGSSLDFYSIASPTSGTYQLQIVRDSGTNGLTRIRHAGTGQFRIECDANALIAFTVNSIQQWAINTDGLYPMTDNADSLGGASNRPTVLYAVSGTINTSDAGAKVDFGMCPGLDFIAALDMSESEWRYRDGRRIKRKTGRLDQNGDPVIAYDVVPGKRRHWGPTAQAVKAALDAVGRDAGIYIDPSVGGEDGELGLRHHEFFGPVIMGMQQMLARIETLEAK